MKTIAIVVLSVLLAAAIIIGSVLYKQHVDARDAIKDELSTKDAMVRKLEASVKYLQTEAGTKVSQLQSKYDSLVLELETLRDASRRVSEYEEALRNLKSAVEYERKAKEDLKTQLLSKDAKVRELEGKIIHLESEVETKVHQLQSKYDSLLSQLKTQLLSRDATLRVCEDKVAANRKERGALQHQLSALSGQKDQLKSKIEELQSAHSAIVSQLRNQIQNREVTIGHLEEKLSITFVDRILFEFGKASITPQGKEILMKVGEILKNVRAKQIRVVGHTDNIPIMEKYRYKFPSNWELSAARASAVVRYFQEKVGLNPTDLEAVGRSFYEPVASNETNEGRGHNRRVHIIIAPKLTRD